MKRLIALIMVAMLLVPAVALASDITGAKWYSVITVSNNSTETADVFTTFPLITQNLIDANFLSANLTDCAMHDTSGVDTAFMPSVNATYPWCLYVSHVGEDAFRNYLLYTGGNTDMDGKIRYFPGEGGMTSADNATLELSDNFTIEQKGWIDTDNGTDKNLVDKCAAFRLYVSPTISENITAAVLGWSANHTETLRPDGHNICVIPNESGAACNNHYLNVDEAAADDLGTTVWSGNDATTYEDWYSLGNTGISSCANVSEVRVYVRGELLNTAQWFRSSLRLGGDTTTGTNRSPAAGVWTTYNEALARPGGGDWQQSDLNNLLISAGVKANVGVTHNAYVTQVYVVVTYQLPTNATQVSATGVESGEHIVRVERDIPFFGLGIDTTGSILPVTDNLTLNAPLWQTELDGSPFDTIDATEHTCTVTGATWTSDGRDFDGNDLIAIADFPFLDLDGDFTLIIWVRLDRVDITHGLLAHTNEATNNRQWLLAIAAATNRTILVHSSTGNSWDLTAVNGANAKVIDTWYCISITRTGTTYQIYENGVADGAAVGEAGAHFATNVDGSIGSRIEGGSYLEGTVGEVLMYDRGLSPAELVHHYDVTKGKYGIDNGISLYSTLSSVPDNANDWTFLQNYSMPYMEYHKIWISGVLRQHIEYEYDDTVFSDLSGNSQDAYPTFRGASSDADVSASMASWQPIEEAKAPPWVLGVERDFWDTENITATGTFTTTPSPTAAPGVAVIEAIATASATPSQLPFNVIAGFVILAISLTGSWFLAKHGSRNLWLKITLVTICMAVCVAVRVFDFWMVVFFLIMAIAVALFSRRRSEG